MKIATLLTSLALGSALAVGGVLLAPSIAGENRPMSAAERQWLSDGLPERPPFDFDRFRRWYHQAGTPVLQLAAQSGLSHRAWLAQGKIPIAAAIEDLYL